VLRHLGAAGRWDLTLVCRTDSAVDRLAAEAAEVCAVERIDVIRPVELLRLRRLVRDSDAVHLNLAFPSGKYQLAAALVSELARRPLVVTHHLALDVPRPWALFMRRLGRAARRHIVLTAEQRRYLIDRYAYPPERIAVIHNGVDPAVFKPPADGRPGTDDPTCISVARLSPQKGLDVLLDAIGIVRASMPRVRLRLIGEGALRDQLLAQAGALGLREAFVLEGGLGRAEVAARLAEADVFALPSRYEGSPLALMEAMASGLACVATDVSGVRELIPDGDHGRVVPVGDARAMAAAIAELLGDADLRAAIGRRARQAVLDGFTIERSMRETEAVLAEAVG